MSVNVESKEPSWFGHEKLEVYRESIAFIGWLSELLDATTKVGDVRDQLDEPRHRLR